MRYLILLLLCIVVAACQTDGAEQLDVAETSPVPGVAENAEREGNHEAAARQYLAAFERNTADAANLIAGARNLRYAGRAGDGLKIMTRFYPDFVENADFRFELGKTRIAAGKSEGAVEDLEFVTAASPDNWEAFSALGIAHDMTESFGDAQAAYRTAMTLSDSDPTVLNNYAISLALSGDVEGAIVLLKDQPRAIRRSAHIRQNLAMFLAIQGDMETAGELARMDLDQDQVDRNLQFFQEFNDD